MKRRKDLFFSINMGTISISHSWNCRIFILFSTTIMCLFFTTFLIRYNGDPSKKNHQSSNSSTSTSSIVNYFKLKEIFYRRKQNLQKICQKYSHPLISEYAIASAELGQYNPYGKFERFYEFKDQHFSMCTIPKVASTSQTELFMRVAKSEYGTGHRNGENWIADQHIRNVTQESLSKNYRTMVVRHPFERLLSAYLWFLGDEKKKDKACSVCPKMTSDILKVLNENPDGSDNTLSFAQFISFLLHGTRSETVDLNLSRRFHHNVHWMPYWRLCTPCHKDAMPTAIVKMDSPGQLREELDYVFKEAGMADLMEKHGEHIFHVNKTPKKSTRTKDFFSTLTKNQILNLHFKYRHDFEMFDYSIEPYLTYARENK